MQNAVRYYKFEQNGFDEFLAGPMTVTNADYAAGRSGYAIQFNDSAETASFADVSSSDMSASMWIYIDTLPADGESQTLIGQNAENGSMHLFIFNILGVYYLAYYDSATTNVQAISSVSLATGTWYHVVLLLHGTYSVIAYLNNVFVGKQTANVIDNTTYPAGQIGNITIAGNPYPFKGRIDNLIFFDKILNTNEIESLYRENSLLRCQKNYKMKTFRRLWMKRREASGEYETSWQEIPSAFVKSYGTIQYSLDDIIPAFFKQSEITIELVNDNGYFSPVSEPKSFFYKKLVIPGTLVKIEAGYVDEYGVELDINSCVYIGAITGDIAYKDDFSVSYATRNLASFLDFPVSKIGLDTLTGTSSGIAGQLTASEVVTAVRDYVDNNSIAIFQKYIPSAAWTIETTTTQYNFSGLQLENENCWQLFGKLAGAEKKVVYVDGRGQLFFKTVNIEGEEDVSYYFVGVDQTRNNSNPVNIKSGLRISDNLDEVYNRIKIKFGTNDTTTSYQIYDIDWDWGDTASGFYFGTKEYSYDNTFLNSTTADDLSRELFIEYEWPRRKVEFDAIFVPQLEIQDKVNVTYRTKFYDDDSTKWGSFLWGKANWFGRKGYNINIQQKDFTIKKIAHNLNNFSTKISARERRIK